MFWCCWYSEKWKLKIYIPTVTKSSTITNPVNVFWRGKSVLANLVRGASRKWAGSDWTDPKSNRAGSVVLLGSGLCRQWAGDYEANDFIPAINIAP